MRACQVGSLGAVAVVGIAVATWHLTHETSPPRGESKAKTIGQDLDATSTKRPAVQLVVVDHAGVGVAGVAVAVDGQVMGTTDSEGRLAGTEMPPSQASVAFSGPNVFATTARWPQTPNGGHPEAQIAVRVVVSRKLTLPVKITNDGRPVQGARVSVRGGEMVARHATSDAHGDVVFTDLHEGAYEIWAQSTVGPPLASGLTRIAAFGQPPPPQNVVLVPATSVRCVVRGIPNDANATVTAVPSGHDNAIRTAPVAKGGFKIPALPRGRWDVHVSSPGYVQEAVQVVVAESDQASCEVDMEKAASIEGHVTDFDGNPIAGARIEWRYHKKPPVSGPPRGRDLETGWVHPLASPRQLPIRASRRFGAARTGARPPECGLGHCGVDIGTTRGAVVHSVASGTVVAIARHPRGNAGKFVVVAHSGGSKTFYLHLDSIVSDVEIGTRVTGAQPLGTVGSTGTKNSGPHLHFAHTLAIDGRNIYVDPQLTLQNAVLLSRARPLPTVDSPAPAVFAIKESTKDKKLATDALTTDSTGAFKVANLVDGKYRLVVHHPDFAVTPSELVAVTTGEHHQVTVELDPGATVYGTVLGPSGVIADAKITARPSGLDGPFATSATTSDRSGRFSLRALSGNVTIAVHAVGHGDSEKDVSLTSRRERGTTGYQINFDLKAHNATLRGRITDASGFAVPSAKVRIVSGPSSRARRVLSDTEGFFAFANVAPGLYRLEVTSAQHPRHVTNARAQNFAYVRLPAGTSLECTIIDDHTQASLEDVQVIASGPDRHRSQGRTDARGHIRFAALAAGTWTLSAKKKGYADATWQVVLKASTPQVKVLGLRRGATVAGVVRNADGDRQPGAVVTIGGAKTTSDQHGRFELRSAPTGQVVLRATFGNDHGEQTLSLSPGDHLVTLELNLEP